jgi:hypothetical protein
MTGTWLTAVARRVLRSSTYDAIAAPAIADLQHEARTTSGVRLVRSYAGVLRALIGASGRDIGRDLREVFDLESARVVWAPAATWAAGLSLVVLIGASINADARYRPELVATLLAGVAVFFAPFLTVPAAFALSRRGTAHSRSLAAAVVVITAVSWAAAFGMRPTRERLELTLEAARWHVAAKDGSGMAQRLTAGQSMADTARMLDGPIRAREREALGFWKDLRVGLGVPLMALVGVALARSRGWMVPVRFAAMTGAWMLLTMTILSWGIGRNLPAAHQGWRDLVLVLIVATVFLGPRAFGAAKKRRPA